MATIKNILLHLDSDDRNGARSDVAFELASKYEAHLVGLFAFPGPSMIHAYGEASIAQEIVRQHEAQVREAAIGLREDFERAAKNAGLSYEWRMEEERSNLTLAVQARYADLVIVSQTNPETSTRTFNLAEEVVMASGAPTLTVPYAGTFDKIGGRVMIAWNGSRESSRAVRDSLPLLENASQVIIYSVNPETDHVPGADIATHLARHGVKVEAKHSVAQDIEISDAILGAISDNDIDLLVMGAYGHARFREFVLGGATRDILGHMTVPTLLSH